jgi:hypothetical protein
MYHKGRKYKEVKKLGGEENISDTIQRKMMLRETKSGKILFFNTYKHGP